MLISSAGNPTYFSWVNTAGAGASSVIYAPTGGEYVTYVANNTLSAERVLTAGSSVMLVTDATAIYINALTGGAGGSGITYAPMEWTFIAGNAVVWTNMPAAHTPLFGNSGNYIYADLTQATSARLQTSVVVAGTAPAYFQLLASTNNGTTWQPMVSATTHCAMNIGVVGIRSSPFVLFNTALRREVVLQVIGSSGNGAIDPSFGYLALQVK